MQQYTVLSLLEAKFRDAFTKVGLDNNVPVRLVESTNLDFGDYQVNGVMGAAKALKMNPRELATKIIEQLNVDEIIGKLEIAGPGFINITLNNTFLVQYLQSLTEANKFGIANLAHKKENVIVDLSSPNLAKEMHVGHLRSTVIGDSIARVFEYMGDNVIRQNHVGDYGTQFGMLIAYMKEELKLNSTDDFAIDDLEDFYRRAKVRFDSDEDFANLSRQYVVKLQSDNPEDTVIFWKKFRDASLSHCQKVYDKLDVNLTINDVKGESEYDDRLSQVVVQLKDKKLLVESDGALCVFFAEDELAGSDTAPFIVQKKDGGYLYATTDLAAIDYRVKELHANRIIYVVDARQAFHFKQLFTVAKKAGFANHDTDLFHSAFGTMMNEDGKPFKTRDGGTVKLSDLIDEAILRATNIIKERNSEWSDDEINHLAHHMAIGAIKYSDLSKNRNSDYIFSFDKMLSFEGNTAPYLLYAYTRINSLTKKVDNIPQEQYVFTHTSEHRLASHIAKFADVLNTVAQECHIHYLCNYLYSLSGLFMSFYEECPIIKAEDENTRQSRRFLAQKTAEVLATGLDLLGIKVVERM